MKQLHNFREWFDALEQSGSNAQTVVAGDEQVEAETVAEVATYLPVIRDAFAEAFDCEFASCAITSSDESDFPVYVGLDASCSDPERVSAARASGARSRFYRKLSDILPSPLFDLVGFRFTFPHDGSN